MKKTLLAMVVLSGLSVVAPVSANGNVTSGPLTPVAQLVSIGDPYACDYGSFNSCVRSSVNIGSMAFDGTYAFELKLPTSYYRGITASSGGICFGGQDEVYSIEYLNYDEYNDKMMAYFGVLLNGKPYNDNIPASCYQRIFNGLTFYTF
jgi:hypothetical protein